jgi:hypothetical protein
MAAMPEWLEVVWIWTVANWQDLAKWFVGVLGAVAVEEAVRRVIKRTRNVASPHDELERRIMEGIRQEVQSLVPQDDHSARTEEVKNLSNSIQGMLSGDGCTVDELAESLGMSAKMVENVMEVLVRDHGVERSGGRFVLPSAKA